MDEASATSSTGANHDILDVLIMGAGQAGMAAAHRLLTSTSSEHSSPLRVHIVEAHTYVGGRTRNLDVVTQQYDTATDDVIELGGTWLSPDHTAVVELCHQLDIPLFRASFIPQDENGTANAQQGNQKQQEQDEWPWWYWGSDFSLQEQARMKADVILHIDATATATASSSSSKIRFSKPRQLMNQLHPKLLQVLNAMGDIIDTTLSDVIPDLDWSSPTPGTNWSQVDMHTTASRLESMLVPHIQKQSFNNTNNNSCEITVTNSIARNILSNVIHNKNAQEPSRVGFLYNLFSFKGCNSDGPDSEFRVQGGTQAIPLAVAKRIVGPHRMTLGDPITLIEQQEYDCDCAAKRHLSSASLWCVQTKSGLQFRTKTLIVTGSPPAINKLHFVPPLPSVQAQLFDSMPMGTSRKICAIYHNGPWWRSLGLTGDVLAASLPSSLCVPTSNYCSSGSSQQQQQQQPIFGQCFDTSPHSQRYGVLTCFVEGKANQYFSTLDCDQQHNLFLAFLKLSFEEYCTGMAYATTNTTGATSNKDDECCCCWWKPDDIQQYNWADDPYIRGAYTAFVGPGVLSVPPTWTALRQMEKLPNLFVAGSDYHVGFGNGYIEGAVRSGQQAASLVVERLGRQQKHQTETRGK